MPVFDVTVTVRNNVRRMRAETATSLSTRAVRHTPTPWRLEPSHQTLRAERGRDCHVLGPASPHRKGVGSMAGPPEDEAGIPRRAHAELTVAERTEWSHTPEGRSNAGAPFRLKTPQSLLKKDEAGSVRHGEEKHPRDLQKRI